MSKCIALVSKVFLTVAAKKRIGMFRSEVLTESMSPGGVVCDYEDVAVWDP